MHRIVIGEEYFDLIAAQSRFRMKPPPQYVMIDVDCLFVLFHKNTNNTYRLGI